MDFFYYQDRAKGHTFRLLALFIAGVAVISVLTGALLTLAIGIAFPSGADLEIGTGTGTETPSAPFDVMILLVTSSGTAAMLGVASLVKSMQVKTGGGAYIASSLGGRRLNFNSVDSDERQLTNIVEEIAIAAGMPVPAVFILDSEPGINAFAAGWTHENSVIGVTRGALNHLTRAELQGVIAHEFAHIYNGDTRIKTKLIGVVFGIVVIAFLGRLFLHSGGAFGRSKKGRQDGAAIILALGAALMILGFLGTWFTKRIQAAVSRQREYLADASGVQFTRDPESLATALAKIGGLAKSNGLVNPHSGEASHLFFASAFANNMSSHPKLENRIRRIMPSWNGEFPKIELSAPTGYYQMPNLDSHDHNQSADAPFLDVILGRNSKLIDTTSGLTSYLDASTYMTPDHVGSASSHLDQAQTIINSIDPDLVAELRTPIGATLNLVAMLITPEERFREKQLSAASSKLSCDPNILDSLNRKLMELDERLHLPVVDLALHSIALLPAGERSAMLEATNAIDESAEDLNLFRWVLHRIIVRHLENIDSYKTKSVKIPLHQNQAAAHLVVATVAGYTNASFDEISELYNRALNSMGLPPSPLPDISSITFNDLDGSLLQLNLMSQKDKDVFLDSISNLVAADGVIALAEAQILRAVADAIGRPIPPLMPT